MRSLINQGNIPNIDKLYLARKIILKERWVLGKFLNCILYYVNEGGSIA